MRHTVTNVLDAVKNNLPLTDCYRGEYHSLMTDPNVLRLGLLRQEIAKHESVAAFARAHPGLDETYIRNLLRGARAFGERSARNIGAKYFGTPEYFMPKPEGFVAPATTDCTLDAILASVKTLPPAAIERIRVEVEYLSKVAALAAPPPLPPKAKRIRKSA